MATSTETNEKRKPVTVFYHNKTKCKKNIADLKARQYSVKAGTRRWPVAVFCEILNLISINGYILYKEQSIEKIFGIYFIFKLISELQQDYIKSKVVPV